MQTVIRATVQQPWNAWKKRTTASLSNTQKSPYKYWEMLGLGSEKGCPTIREMDGYIRVHLRVCEPSRNKARDAFTTSLVTVSNAPFMQTSVLDNRFQTPSCFTNSWGLNRSDGLGVQSWDHCERKTRNWCGFDIWNVTSEAFRMHLCKSAQNKLLEASNTPFSSPFTTKFSTLLDSYITHCVVGLPGDEGGTPGFFSTCLSIPQKTSIFPLWEASKIETHKWSI